MAKECAVKSCPSEELVYSGTAALLLGGIPTEKICYDCANTYAQVKRIVTEAFTNV